MQHRATKGPDGQRDDRSEHGLERALGWALGGGAVILALGLLVYVLAVSLGQWIAGTPELAMTRLASAPMYREFTALFLIGFLAIFIGREFGVRTR